MADVTISQLPQGIPSGDNILPYSTSSNTLGVPISAIFQNTKAVGIGTSKPSPIGLTIRTGYAESFPLGGPVPLLLSGGDTNSFMAFHVDLDNQRKTCLTDSVGARTIVFDNNIPGATNLQIWNNNVETIRIIANNNVGIGTSTPSAKLDVNGNVKVTGCYSGYKKEFTNLSTYQSTDVSATIASSYICFIKSVTLSQQGLNARAAFLLSLSFDLADIRITCTALGGCTANGASISGIAGDPRTYTFNRNHSTGYLEVAASSIATGVTTFAWTPINLWF